MCALFQIPPYRDDYYYQKDILIDNLCIFLQSLSLSSSGINDLSDLLRQCGFPSKIY